MNLIGNELGINASGIHNAFQKRFPNRFEKRVLRYALLRYFCATISLIRIGITIVDDELVREKRNNSFLSPALAWFVKYLQTKTVIFKIHCSSAVPIVRLYIKGGMAQAPRSESNIEQWSQNTVEVQHRHGAQRTAVGICSFGAQEIELE